MVTTVKFSEFAQGVLSNPTNSMVGVSSSSGGANIQVPFPLTWNNANRPITPVPGTFGYNSSLSQLEFWNGVSWVQLAAGGSGTVGLGAANEIAYYPSNGTSVDGLTTSNNAGLFTNGSGVPSMVAATGTGAPVRQTSPSLITPTLGVSQATSLQFTSTAGIIGTTTNNNANVGSVGEYIESIIPSSSSVLLTNGVAKDLTSIVLHPGDYDVWANITFFSGGGTISLAACWISTTSATFPDVSLVSIINNISSTFAYCGLTAPSKRISVAVNTTIFLSGISTFALSTVEMSGGLFARVRR